ncbi:MAG: PH domain-containing protein, partial [Dehalococcoidia bacterium]|nr:PH domain-containing protein [Dehalococcoidia bacterium]
MVFRPPRALGVIVGGALAVWAGIIAGLAANVAIGAPAEPKTLVAWVVAAGMFLLALAFANWTFAVYSLAYHVDDEALTITWGWRRVVVPIASIQRMIPGRTIDEPRVDGLNWWGLHVGVADVTRVGYTMVYSTHSTPDELLYIVTSDASYAITVIDQAAFAEEIQARAIVGASPTVPQR